MPRSRNVGQNYGSSKSSRLVAEDEDLLDELVRIDQELADAKWHRRVPWRSKAREKQLPPPDWGRAWYIRGGRGSGKTWTASNSLAEIIIEEWDEPGEFGVVAPTLADCRNVCYESATSGLLVALGGVVAGSGGEGTDGAVLIDRGPYIAAYSRGECVIRLRNGSVVFGDGADDGAYRIQGHNLKALWGDEVGLWKKWKAAYDESIRYAVRMNPAKVILTGTPKRNLAARQLVARLIKEPDHRRVVNTQLYTEENFDNLSEAAREEFLASRGTALERQELYGELLEAVEGALWTPETIDSGRLDFGRLSIEDIYEQIQPTRIGVAIDPAASSDEDSDETGMIVVAKGHDGHGYVLKDLSGRYPVTKWPLAAKDACELYQADRLIAEVNHGADYIGATVQASGYRGGYTSVRASRGKLLRAEPVSQSYQQGMWHHTDYFEQLEEQMTTWVPDQATFSPDRVDALVYGAFFIGVVSGATWSTLYSQEEEVIGEPEPPKRRGWGSMYTSSKPEQPERMAGAPR